MLTQLQVGDKCVPKYANVFIKLLANCSHLATLIFAVTLPHSKNLVTYFL